MRILVLGGNGRVGRGVAWDLIRSDDVSEVVIGDIKLKEAENYVARVGSNKLTAEYVDLKNTQALIEKLREFDAIANAVWFDQVVDVTKAVIEARRHCCDAGGFYYDSLRQLKLSKDAEKAGITVIMGMGNSPGITNICARYAADKLDKVHKIRIIAGGHVAQPGSTLSGRSMTIRTNFEELTSNPMIFKDGRMIEVSPLSGRELVLFPEPLGEREVFYARHSEMATLPFFRGVKDVDVKLYFSKESREQVRVLDELGLTSNNSITIGDLQVQPRRYVMECLYNHPSEVQEPEGEDVTMNQTIISGEKNGEMVEYTYTLIVQQDFKWGNQKTGVPMSIGCQMLARGDIKEKGVLAPEICIDPEKFFVELRKRTGFKIIEEYKRIRAL